MRLTEEQVAHFRAHIYDYYHSHKRHFIWREHHGPYNVVISEVMLQQTQTDRVAPKYEQFLAALPNFEALAHASTRDVISLWQGLGYNRRAVWLQKLAQQVVQVHGGILPACVETVDSFPGIGKATASSICAFAFNMPTIFIETNIRTVYIHFFFSQHNEVHDKELLPLVEQTVDLVNPRQWYYALMDYGVMLKKLHKNPSRKSAHYTKQSKFEGSERQIRGMILRALTQYHRLTFGELCEVIAREPQRIERNLSALCGEQLVQSREQYYFL